MNFIELFRNIRERPGMYVFPEKYYAVAAFVSGFDAGRGGDVLIGFREWLVSKLSRRYANLAWQALVLEIVFENEENPQEFVSLSDDNEREAINKLFDLIEEFTSIKKGE